MENKCINCVYHSLSISGCQCMNHQSENYKRMIADGYVCKDYSDEEQASYDFVDHPSHYNKPGQKETIEKLVDKYGIENAILWCKMTADKYRDRKGSKPGEPIEREEAKINWYEHKSKELEERLHCVNIQSNTNRIGHPVIAVINRVFHGRKQTG